MRQHLRGGAIDDLIAEHADGRRNRGGALWTLLTLEVFLESRTGEPIAAAPARPMCRSRWCSTTPTIICASAWARWPAT